MIKDTYRRLLPTFEKSNIIVSTIPEFAGDIKKILPEIPAQNYIIEPALMGNAAACGLVSEILLARDKHSVAFFMPADAFIADQKEFNRVIKYAQTVLRDNPNKILTIGIRPSRADTGYGYIKVKNFSLRQPAVSKNNAQTSQKLQSFPVNCFVEKPDLKTAKKYLKSGRFLWNAGIFGWRTDFILKLFKKNMPKTYSHLEKIRAHIGQKDFLKVLKVEYSAVENTSIDFGIIEKTKDILVIPADFGWSDVGSWGSLLDVLAQINKTDSIHRGHHVGIDNLNCLVLGGEKLIATIGLKNIAIIDTPDALLICDKDQSHKVKEVLQKLDEKFL